MTAEEQVRFRVLGTLQIRAGQEWVRVDRPRRRAVLAYLLLAPNRIVTSGELVEAIWGPLPPATARSQIQIHISAIRKVLAICGHPEAILTTTGGYELTATTEHIDYHVFCRCLSEAARLAESDEWTGVCGLLSEAVALWRGTALADVVASFVEPAQALMEDKRLNAFERLAEAGINLGAIHEQIPVLREVVAAHPERERAAALLMLALHRSGRRAEALGVARVVRAHLRDHHGLDPSREILDAERHILHDSARTGPTEASEAKKSSGIGAEADDESSKVRLVPTSWLPRAPRGFVGRSEIVDRLIRSADHGDRADESPIWMIDGMPGIGKTALAIHVARSVQDRYSDGQLFIDLQGHGERAPRKTGIALRMLLDQMGYAATQVPASVEARAALWRDELARRRCVVILDNAASSEQIASLLPDAAGSLVIVTSRRRLTDTTGYRAESLPLLTISEGVELLATAAGQGRTLAEPEAAAEIVELCGHLPLALRLAGARLRRRTTWSVADFAVRLRDAPVLSELAAEDHTMTAAFSTSYEKLGARVQTAFRALGILPLDFATAYTIAAATGSTLQQARRDLEELADANLVVEYDVERYRLHDLLKSYAASLANATDSPHIRAALVAGLYDYYAAAATVGLRQYEKTDLFCRYLPKTSYHRQELLPVDASPAWIESEYANLLVLIRSAAALGHHRDGAQLALRIWGHVYTNCAAEDIIETQTVALAAAKTLGDESLAAAAHNYLASGHYCLGNPTGAERHLSDAIAIHRAAGDWVGVYGSQVNLAIVHLIKGRISLAARMLEDSIRDASALDLVTTLTLSNLGTVYSQLGDLEKALRVGRAALIEARQLGSQRSLIAALAALAATRLRAGHLIPAYRMLRVCLLLNRKRRLVNAADILNDLGSLYRSFELYEEAEKHHRQALDSCTVAGTSNIRAKVLNDLALSLFKAGRTGALETFEQAIQLATTIGNVRERARALHGKAICLTDDHPEQARLNLKMALTLFDQMEVPERFDVARQLAELDEVATTGGSALVR